VIEAIYLSFLDGRVRKGQEPQRETKMNFGLRFTSLAEKLAYEDGFELSDLDELTQRKYRDQAGNLIRRGDEPEDGEEGS
jgi:hypothetical protein